MELIIFQRKSLLVSSKRARGEFSCCSLVQCCFRLDHLTDAPWYDNLFLGTLTAESMKGASQCD